MSKERGIQGCLYCGKLLYVDVDCDNYVYCNICGKDGKDRKREYHERI